MAANRAVPISIETIAVWALYRGLAGWRGQRVPLEEIGPRDLEALLTEVKWS